MPAKQLKFTIKRKGSAPVSRSSPAPKSIRPMRMAPVSIATSIRPKNNPRIVSSGKSTIVSHSEYFAPVVSSGTGFAVTSYNVNPGVASCFPWLSQIGQRYESYKFHGLEFSFHSSQATTAVGTVGLVFDFDPADDPPASLMAALSYHDKVADSVWSPSVLRLDLAQGDKSRSLKTRAGMPAANLDIKTYDIGRLHVFTDGVAAATIGLLEVKFNVELFTPQIQTAEGGSVRALAGLDATHLFGSDFVTGTDGQANLPVVYVNTSTVRFTQEFEGLLTWYFTGTGLGTDYLVNISADGNASNTWTPFVNAGATGTSGQCKIRAHVGTTLTPTMTATTVTGAILTFSKVGYTQVWN